MSVDVYVGTLRRYYRQDWKTVVEQYALGQGTTVKAPRPPLPFSPHVIDAKVGAWIEQLASRSGEGSWAWDESDERPYFTDKLGWEGLGALLVLAACVKSRRPLPEFTPISQDEFSLVSEVKKDRDDTRLFQIMSPEIWVPLEGWTAGIMDHPMTGQPQIVGSVQCLLRDLVALDNATFQVGQGPIDQPVPDRDGRFRMEEYAPYALAVFTRLASQATEHGLPMLLDK